MSRKNKPGRPTLGLPGNKPAPTAAALDTDATIKALTPNTPDAADIEMVAAHFGITADELRARVEAGPVDEIDDDLDLDGVAGEPLDMSKTMPDIYTAANRRGPTLAADLAAAYVEAKRNRIGPAAFGLSAATETQYFEAALKKVMG